MMKKLYYLLILVLFQNTFAQNITYRTENLIGTGTILIPNMMEKQSGDFKKMAHEIQRLTGNEVTSDRTVFQLKGINEFTSKDPSYEKIIFQTTFGEKGDYEKIGSSTLPTQADLKELSEFYKNDILNASSLMKVNLIAWNDARNVKIGKLNAVKISYVRAINNNTPNYVEIYLIQNNDRLHNLTIAYQYNQKEVWKPIFDKIINSFTITNVR